MRRNSGFSLVELMVTVAIISILATIAFPTYQDMSLKARQSEAKDDLAAIYIAEVAFRGNQDSFTACLFQAGFLPEGKNHNYTTGFWLSGGVFLYDIENGLSCSIGAQPWIGGLRNDCTFWANIVANPALAAQNLAASYGAFASTFKAVAFGSIYVDSPVYDIWTIDQSKSLLNVQVGF